MRPRRSSCSFRCSFCFRSRSCRFSCWLGCFSGESRNTREDAFRPAAAFCVWSTHGTPLARRSSCLLRASLVQPPPIYAAALLAQFAFDFASTAARDRLGLGVPPLSLLPVMAWIWVVDSALTPIAILAALGSLAHPELVLFSLPLIGLLAHFARDRKSHIDKALELSNAYRGTAFLLGDVVEADDAYTGLHSQDVVSLVLAVGDELKLGPDERRSAEFTAILHDVGKIKIPKEIINKPGPLTDEERAIINTHTIEGQRMLEKVGGLLGEVGYLVRSCHERWDGAGYPDGLAGEQTPLVARIVCACDAFSAMTTNRPYRQAMSRPEAIEELATTCDLVIVGVGD